jgi:FkbM family methyltransferase
MGTTAKAIDLLAAQGIRLTLVDVGASLEPFAPFQPLIGHATYVCFDPDGREMQDQVEGSGRRVVVDKAVIAESEQDKARFLLTANPTCSSTLEPSPATLAPYLHAHRFEVVDTVEVPATTLNQAIESAGASRIDWIKLDTQGTDVRLLRSLSDGLWTDLMTVDAEPGFEQYYQGEDTFAELHREMVGRGFWLADMVLTTGVRLRRSVFDDRLQGRSRWGRLAYEVTLKRSPMAAGPRYLRTVDALRDREAARADYLRLWACATFSGNHPFALDVVAACEERYGEGEDTTAMGRLSVRANKAYARRNTWRHANKLTWRNIRHRLRWK